MAIASSPCPSKARPHRRPSDSVKPLKRAANRADPSFATARTITKTSAGTIHHAIVPGSHAAPAKTSNTKYSGRSTRVSACRISTRLRRVFASIAPRSMVGSSGDIRRYAAAPLTRMTAPAIGMNSRSIARSLPTKR